MSSSRWPTTGIPAPEVFFLEVPPYTSFPAWDFKAVLRIEFFQGTLDTYCPECGKESVFASKASLPPVGLAGPEPHLVYPESLEDLLENYSQARLPPQLQEQELQAYATSDRIFSLACVCTRDATHLLIFIFRVQDHKIAKIGQSPSLADLQSQEIRKYRKALGDSKYREFNRAVGLSAHGVGIGAFVYLRRIFEDLIEGAHSEAAKAAGWDEESFERSHMDEKILMLKGFLPPFLVENRAIYSILSKGIHSLTEEECLKYFEPLKLGIELILDEKIEQEERAEKISRTRKTLDSIRSELT